MTDKVDELIFTIISEKSKVPRRELAPDTEIYDSRIISSLAMLELIEHIEHRFSIVVLPEELTEDNFRDIQTIIDFVHQKAAA